MKHSQSHFLSAVLICALLLVGVLVFDRVERIPLSIYIPPASSQRAQLGSLANDSSLVYSMTNAGAQTSFNGITDRVVTSFNPATGLVDSMSISVWIKPTEIKPGAMVYSAKNSGSSRFYFGIKDTFSNGRVTAGVSSWNPTVNSSVVVNEWQHYVVVLNGTDGYLYRNGNLIQSTQGIVKSFPSSAMVIGSDEVSSATSFFPGSIEDLSVFNRGLSADEVLGIYNSGSAAHPHTTTPTNGSCGPAAKTYTSTESFPSGAYCTTGTASPTSPSDPSAGGSSSWSCGGSGGGTTASCDASRVSTEQVITRTLTVNRTLGTGSGTVSGGGVNCGSTCTVSLNQGSSVTLTAQAQSGSVFGGWSGACSGTATTCTVVMDNDVTVGATFTSQTVITNGKTLTARVYGTGSGTLTGPGIDCGADCSEMLGTNTTVSVTAVPASGSVFARFASSQTAVCAGDMYSGTCRTTMYSDRSVVAIFGRAPTRSGSVLTAASCEMPDVQAAIQTAQDGDTVQVPPGTCTWNDGIVIREKAITVKGAIDTSVSDPYNRLRTIIIDELPNRREGLVSILFTKSGSIFRLTQFHFKGGTTNRGTNFDGNIQLTSTKYESGNPLWRIDHNFLNGLKGRPMYLRAFNGVVDHNKVEYDGSAGIVFDGRIPDNSENGHWSWATPVKAGTADAGVYLEDNILVNTPAHRGATDGFAGARYVIRFNKAHNASAENHGTESTGIPRGTRWMEIYNNDFTADILSECAILFRSGSGVVFNNTTSGKFNCLSRMVNYRNTDPYGLWGQADGANQWDLNYPSIFDSGTHSGTSGIKTLTANRSWTTNQWVGYTVRNLTTGKACAISANTANTLTCAGPVMQSSLPVWSTGDSFEIRRLDRAIDQPGSGTGDLLVGGSDSQRILPSPYRWPNQALDPIYYWSNSGVSTAIGSYYSVIQGRDYIVGSCRPGYTPYTYPHPLIQQQDGVSSIPIQLNCTGTPTPVNGICGSTKDTCSLGQFSDVADSDTHYRWSCSGYTGGSTAQCSLPKTVNSPLTGDFNLDGIVNATDFSLMADDWNKINSPYDLNKDGIVNTLDFSLLISNWTR